jgi:nicotinamide-nucleotide amidase
VSGAPSGSGAQARPKAAVVLTGAELLDGRLRDANGTYLAAELTRAGFSVDAIVVCPDDHATIVAHLRHLLAGGARAIVTSGGLGTTHDDVTMAAVAGALGLPLVEDPEAWVMVQERVRGVAERRHFDAAALLEQARKQALLPQGALLIPPAGLAPGALVDAGNASVVVLPGPPTELQAMWPAGLIHLRDRCSPVAPRVTLLRLYGVGEMQVQPLLEPFTSDPALDVAITASLGEISVRVAAWDEAGRRRAASLREALAAALPVYSADGHTVDELLARQLRARGATVAAAESCTGGLLGGRFTSLSGSSDYFVGSVVSYANSVKHDVLGVAGELLDEHGAVSEQVAAAMAQGVRRLTGATYGLSTTGIAGPGGGTPAKPVGLVYLACADAGGVVVEQQRFPGDRDAVRLWTVVAALHLLRRRLEASS